MLPAWIARSAAPRLPLLPGLILVWFPTPNRLSKHRGCDRACPEDRSLCLSRFISVPLGHPVNESENLRLRQDGGLHSLHIARVGSEDEGLYEVSATNTHGQAHCSAQLYVEEPRTAASGPRYHLGPQVLPAVPLRDPYPEPGGYSWVAMWFLQLEAGEDAIYP